MKINIISILSTNISSYDLVRANQQLFDFSLNISICMIMMVLGCYKIGEIILLPQVKGEIIDRIQGKKILVFFLSKENGC